MMADAESFDVIIVGAGSAGCVLAGRLAERGGLSVALVEAGRRRWPKITTIPAAVTLTFNNPHYDWGFTSEPDPSRDGRTEIWSRGKLPGGSSAINGMIFVRGNPADYDAWAELGAPGWDYRSVLPYFRSLETTGRQDQYRGDLGPLPVSAPPYEFSLTKDFIAATLNAGFPPTDDYNGAHQFGAGVVQANQRRGRRVSAFDAFVAPQLRKGRLRLIEGATTTRILLDGKRAIGIEVRHKGKTRQLLARERVVLSAGAIQSPHLLMLSGIGPAEHLRASGITPVIDMPEVGQNMREHVGVWLGVRVDVPTVNQVVQGLQPIKALAQWLVGKGPATAAMAQAVAFLNLGDPYGRSDLQFHFSPLLFAKELGWRKMVNDRLLAIVPSLNHPRSVGSIELAGPDPLAPPKISPNLLGDPRDIALLGQGIRKAQAIMQAPPFADHVEAQLDPPPADDGDAMAAYIRERAAPLYHPVGSCRMGTDAHAVVTPALHVCGIANLMVVDASVMPAHVSGNTNAVCMMIGEKAAADWATASSACT
jgi:choline dehydrogenase